MHSLILAAASLGRAARASLLPALSPAAGMRVLCINAGSSSIKVSLYEVNETAHSSTTDSHAAAASSASGSSSLPAGVKLMVSKSLKADEDPVQTLQHFVAQQQRDEAEHAKQSEEPHPHPIRIIAHRIVHGGHLFHKPTLLDEESTKQLETLNALAPLHNPPALKWIHAANDAFVQPKQQQSSGQDQEQQRAQANAHAVQVAVFDTSFFHELPLPAQTYALPAELIKKHNIRRYGFHGIAHEFMLRSSPFASTGRAVSLQLGSGCSAAAARAGCPVDTSMGFAPLPGLVMATRCGDVDAALVTFLQKHEPRFSSPDATEDMLYHKAGLLGLTAGQSNDMQAIEKGAAQGSDCTPQQREQMQLAIDVFAHNLLKTVGGYVALLGGLDGLLFGGGIGEHSASVRARLVDSLAQFLPVQLDRTANDAAGKSKDGQQVLTRISTQDSKIAVYVVAVDEAAFMLRDALNVHRESKQQQ